MEKFICENVYIPLRYGPTHKSEMVSQILFGEKYSIIDESGSWIKIKSGFDDYCGWIDSDHILSSPDDGPAAGRVLNRTLLCFRDDNSRMVLEAGCEIFNPDFDKGTFTAGRKIYRADSGFSPDFIANYDTPADIAMRFINSPYILGGRISSGIDCSGLTQLVYKISGIRISRDAATQAAEGLSVEFLEEALPGDLVFFGDKNEKISHVGMIISKGLVIHAAGRVRIDPIDHQGIFRQEINRYSHNLRIIKRITVQSYAK